MTPVRVDAVTRGPLVQTIPVIGRLVARQSGPVAARSAGPVAEVLVEVGDRVKKDQVLVRLVTETLNAQRSVRIAELTRARLELRRFERLRQRGSAAFPRARYETAVQDVARAVAALKLAQIEFDYAEIRAPYSGVIAARRTEAGAYVKPGDAVVTMVNDRSLEIEADVPANRIGGLGSGVAVTFRIENRPGGRFAARVRAVVPVDNPMTRTRAVRFTPDLAAGREMIAVNQSVTVDIPVGNSRRVVSVHKDAILHKQGRTLVYVVAGGKAMIRPVRLGDAVDSRFIVIAGLRAGELVVIRGNERLRPGQAVRYGKAAKKPPTKPMAKKTQKGS
ncbi:MAG: efflux RND transporter periplasmic adaptor subunit [Alphaproteobacteria bacterium]